MSTPAKTASKAGAVKGGRKGGPQPGSGRPRKDGHKKTFYLSNDVIELITVTARQMTTPDKKISDTDVVEAAVREFVRHYGVAGE